MRRDEIDDALLAGGGGGGNKGAGKATPKSSGRHAAGMQRARTAGKAPSKRTAQPKAGGAAKLKAAKDHAFGLFTTIQNAEKAGIKGKRLSELRRQYKRALANVDRLTQKP